MKRIAYRSTGLVAGAFNNVGAIHAHIDGAESQRLVLGIVKALEARGNPGTLDHILHAAVGPQRELSPDTYAAHTPMLEGEEAFDFFSSSLIRDRQDAIAVLQGITGMLTGTPGAIIEIEQNVAWLDASGWDLIPSEEQLLPIRPEEVSAKPQPSMRYEIHHGIEIPKIEPAVSLPKLLRFCRKNDVMVGGWFMFDDGENWSYWSNSFTNEPDFQEMVAKEQSALVHFLSEEGLQARVCALVELVLGIWHSEA